MHERPETERSPKAAERAFREELARADLAIASVRPVLRHFLANDDPALVNDEIVARVRAMLSDVARQLLEVQAQVAGLPDIPAFVAEHGKLLVKRLSADSAFLVHVHALALEGRLLESLNLTAGIDPAVSPVTLELAAGEDRAAAELAMQVLAAQTRFIQHHRRMALPLGDLPAEMFHAALEAHEDQPSGQRLREFYQENAGRPALLGRVAIELRERPRQGLSLEDVGVSVFASVLSLASGQPREVVIASMMARRGGRLALALRAAGLAPREIDSQIALLHPDEALSCCLDLLDTASAGALLAASPLETAY